MIYWSRQTSNTYSKALFSTSIHKKKNKRMSPTVKYQTQPAHMQLLGSALFKGEP